ncbi:MAG: HD domain-containing phosphohydrolase [Pseudomonadota bacterium]
MTRQYSLPFQVLTTLRVAALVLTLTGIFLWFVLGRVQDQIEQSARENFQVFANSAFGELDELTQSRLRYLNTLSKLLPMFPDRFSEATRNALAQTFLKETGQNALTVVWPDDTELYFLRRDIEAPTGAAYTMGLLQVQADDSRVISASYHRIDGSVIARRRIPIDLYPSRSEWHQNALRLNEPYLSSPHPIPGRDNLAMTLSARVNQTVVSLTTPLDMIDKLLQHLPISSNGAALIIDEQLRLIAIHSQSPAWSRANIETARMEALTNLKNPVLTAAALATDKLAENETSLITIRGTPYLMAWHSMLKVKGTQYKMLLLSPLSDMSQVTANARRDAWLITLALLAILLPLSWWGTGRMTRVLQALVKHSQRVGRMDFEPLNFPLQSNVREVKALGLAHESMRYALSTRVEAQTRVSRHLERLVGIGVSLVDKKDRQHLLDTVLDAAREIAAAEGGVLLLRDDDNILQLVATTGLIFPKAGPGLDLKSPQLQHESLAVSTVISGTTIVVDDIETDTRELLTIWRRQVAESGLQVQTAVSLPMRTPDRRVIGVMQILNAIDPDTGQVTRFSASQISYLESLAAQASVALENQKLIISQSRLLDTLVRTLGDAVDAKSAYTGRHCARVPELALMLAEEAHAADSGPLAGFAFNTEDEWREFRTGAWLHDCGKITSPEHVMDKATKLDMVYNRIHEIALRFEVLLRDARTETLLAQIDGSLDAATADARFSRRAEELQEQFALIARCNVGSEKMAAEDIAKLRVIATQNWLRHFDDRLGLSHEELSRHGDASDASNASLPAVEALLTDKCWHLIERSTEATRALTDGFRMTVPEYLYKHGEIYNLCIEYGTLTAEERFKINEHIIHTIRMLEGAQFPPHLQRVPEYAGTHHEAINGSGYPRGLKNEQLSIPARIMAIADIFEALTAADRPYKTAKPLSECIAILHRMKLKGHIDPDLFDLFLRRSVHLRYAHRFLAKEQIDAVNITLYLSNPADGVAAS